MKVRVQGELEIEQKGQSCKGNMQDDTAMQDELLKQLHEQYAVNNNANLGTIVTLVVAVIAVIGYFGYVYVHTGIDFSDDFGCLVKHSGEFYLDALLLIYLASVLVIAILVRLCIYQGVAQRKEQFIVHAIRRRYFGCDYLSQRKKNRIFPKDYHPYKKGKAIPQGLYGELVAIFKLIFLVLTCAVVLKIIANICYYFDLNWDVSSFSIVGAIEVFIVSILIAILVHHSKKYNKAQIDSYEKRKEEYSVKRKKNNTTRGNRQTKLITKNRKTMKQKIFFVLAALMMLTGTSAMAQSETLKGDVNGDGAVDVADIAAVIKIMTDNGDIKTKYYWYVGNGDEIVKNDPAAADIDWSKAQQITSFETLGYSVNGTQITMNNTGENNIYILCPKSWSNKWQFWNVDNTIDLTTGFAEVSEILGIPSFTKDGVEYDLWIAEMYAGNIAHMRSK